MPLQRNHKLVNLPVPTTKGITSNIFTIIDKINQRTHTDSTNNAPQTKVTADMTPASNYVEETMTPKALMPIICCLHTCLEEINMNTPSSRVHGNTITPSTLEQPLLDDTIETIDTPVPITTTANATTNSTMPTTMECVPLTYRGCNTSFTHLDIFISWPNYTKLLYQRDQSVQTVQVYHTELVNGLTSNFNPLSNNNEPTFRTRLN
jgi:hypothetical protein